MSNFSKNAMTVLERRYFLKNEKGEVVENLDGLLWRVAVFVAAGDLLHDGNYAKAVKTARKFRSMMACREFFPNSPTLMNAGRDIPELAKLDRPANEVSDDEIETALRACIENSKRTDLMYNLSACFVLPIEDSMEGIFDSVKHAALIHKSGGGTGFSFSRLRAEGSTVRTTGGVASGPISFMKVFDSATEAVKQGGTRRGANMGMLRVDHPDILKFIDCKKEQVGLNNFNISVAITDTFMKAVKEHKEYALIDPRSGEETGRLDACTVFDKIVDAAWRNGEPGVVFIDKMNAANPTPALGKIESTNPCGEQPLLPFEACNLGSVNLGVCVQTDKESRAYILDEERLRSIVRRAVRFLDNVIDMNSYPLPEIDEMTRKTRKIGLGVMGFADLLLKLSIPYNSKEGENMAEEVMYIIRDEGIKTSKKLAIERGNFPTHNGSIFCGPMRNATVTTIAPTGSISIIADASGGCEPVFAFAFVKNVMDGDKLVVGNPLLEERLKEADAYSPEIMQKIVEQGSLQHIKEIPEDIRRIFVCAHDISPEWHIRIQAAFQAYTDNAVSKTINFPNSATREDVRQAYLLAYELGCKGTTVYRDGSRNGQVLTVGKKEEKAADNDPLVDVIPFDEIKDRFGLDSKDALAGIHTPQYVLSDGHIIVFDDDADSFFCADKLANGVPCGVSPYMPVYASEDDKQPMWFLKTEKGKGKAAENKQNAPGSTQETQEAPSSPEMAQGHTEGGIVPRPRPELVQGMTKKVKIGCGNLFITVNSDEHGVCEVFTSTGKSGGCPSQSEAVARLTSVALRSGVAISEILHQLKGIRCPSTIRQPGISCTSCPDAIARTIEEVLRFQKGLPVLPTEVGFPTLKAPVQNKPSKPLTGDGFTYCPECGKKLRHEGGCVICECGFSHCG